MSQINTPMSLKNTRTRRQNIWLHYVHVQGNGYLAISSLTIIPTINFWTDLAKYIHKL